MKSALAILLLLAAAVLGTKLLWPTTKTVQGPPQITTVYDTVDHLVVRLDTVWRTAVVKEVVAGPTLVETVTIQLPPETVVVNTQAVCPQAVSVGEHPGMTTTIEGFTLTYDSLRTLLRQPWRSVYYTTGPLKAIVGDTVPPFVTFFLPPPKPCGFWCKAGLVATGAGVASGACLLRK